MTFVLQSKTACRSVVLFLLKRKIKIKNRLIIIIKGAYTSVCFDYEDDHH